MTESYERRARRARRPVGFQSPGGVPAVSRITPPVRWRRRRMPVPNGDHRAVFHGAAPLDSRVGGHGEK